MIDLPWGGTDEDDEPSEHADAVVVCELQDGTVAVYEEEVVIDRVPRSQFAGKTIPVAEITDVEYSAGITIGYLQIEQSGVPTDAGGLLTDPVNENTLHFVRGDRECAKDARDAILERTSG